MKRNALFSPRFLRVALSAAAIVWMSGIVSFAQSAPGPMATCDDDAPCAGSVSGNPDASGTITATQHTHPDQQQPHPDHAGHSTPSATPVSALQHDMAGMQHNHAHGGMQSENFIGQILHHATSGTSAEPDSTPLKMLMFERNDWQFMLHGMTFLNATQQSGPRGADKIFATGWFMLMAQRKAPGGQLTLRVMASPEPATVTHRFYPELFQQGETAFGKAIADGQHPHDFIMELAALYDVKLGQHGLLSFYAAPVGDPAIGPSAYPHRASASENPLATLGHHLQDSTHIASDVITMGLTYRSVRVEASGFHGREPDELRWNVGQGRLDSWSTRLTAQPGRNWSAQYSFAHLTSPEDLAPTVDLQRMTASVMHNYPWSGGNLATTVVWGRNRQLATGAVFNGYLAESTLSFARHNYLWGRIENADRTTELLPENQQPASEGILARVQALTAGYGREFQALPYLQAELGGQFTFYGKPRLLDAFYGRHPVGGLVFLRLRLARAE